MTPYSAPSLPVRLTSQQLTETEMLAVNATSQPLNDSNAVATATDNGMLAFFRLYTHNLRMNKSIALRRLRRLEPELRRMGATSLYLFGSTADNTARPTSDIDTFYDVQMMEHSRL
jgi:hypothetical protein